jgi:hypothetical protein
MVCLQQRCDFIRSLHAMWPPTAVWRVGRLAPSLQRDVGTIARHLDTSDKGLVCGVQYGALSKKMACILC